MLVKAIQSRMELAIATVTTIYDSNTKVNSTSETIREDEMIGQQFSIRVERPGTILEIEKIMAFHTSRDRGVSECLEAAGQSLERFQQKRFIHLYSLHSLAWKCIWDRCDISVTLNKNMSKPMVMDGYSVSEGMALVALIQPEESLNLILRFHAFHLLQVGSINILGKDVSIPARGLSGESYRGHIFWDELFILPFFHLRVPEVSRTCLLYRSYRLPGTVIIV